MDDDLDPLDAFEQPRCPNCGTVLNDDGPAVVCRGCGYMAVESDTGA